MGSIPLTPDTSQTAPQNERAQFNATQQRLVDFMNTQLKAFYQNEINNWIGLQAHGPTNDPIPVPPNAWAAMMKTGLTADEIAYNQRYQLPPMLVPMMTDQAVAPQYVPPVAPAAKPSNVISIGPYLRDGEYAALPDDTMPDGYMTRGPGGIVLRKVSKPTPFGVASWYETVQA